MFKKIVRLILGVMLTMNLSGCFLFVAGAVGGAGTAVWLSGKLTQEFHASYQATINATEGALQSLHLQITKETHAQDVTQIKGYYSDGSEMWIDIHHVTENSTKIEVRVGGLTPNKEAASEILKKIQSNLFFIYSA